MYDKSLPDHSEPIRDDIPPIKHIAGDPFQCTSCKKRIVDIVEKKCDIIRYNINSMDKDDGLEPIIILHALKSIRKIVDIEISKKVIELRNDDD